MSIDHRCLKNGQEIAWGRHQWGKSAKNNNQWMIIWIHSATFGFVLLRNHMVQLTRRALIRFMYSKPCDTRTLSPTRSLSWTSAVCVSWWIMQMAVICIPKSPTKRKLEEVRSGTTSRSPLKFLSRWSNALTVRIQFCPMKLSWVLHCICSFSLSLFP